jgi:hypothetical protein
MPNVQRTTMQYCLLVPCTVPKSSVHGSITLYSLPRFAAAFSHYLVANVYRQQYRLFADAFPVHFVHFKKTGKPHRFVQAAHTPQSQTADERRRCHTFMTSRWPTKTASPVFEKRRRRRCARCVFGR